MPRERALEFQRKHNIKYWVETSAKTGDHVSQLFFDASKFLYKQLIENGDGSTERSASEASQYSFKGSNLDV